MSDKKHGNPVATYIITALILAVITYIEFAIVEYEIAWLSQAATIFWLVALSVVKFLMVVAIFMHLKDDENTYSGFFTSGMLLALGTFIVLPILFTVASIPEPIAAQAQAGAHGESQGHDGEEQGDPAAELDNPPPMDRSLTAQPPAAGDADAEVGDAPATQPETLGGAAQQDDRGGIAVGEDEADEAVEGADDQEDAVADAEQASADEVAEEPQVGAEATAGTPDATADFNRQAGETAYVQNCQACHQAGGTGLPGVFPPLAEHMPVLYNAEGGREYLIDVVLNGLTGQIEVLGQTYNGAMPPFGQLSDEQVAAVLNHELTSWGNEEQLNEFSPISAGDVAARRDAGAGNMLERRAQLLGQ